MKKILFFMVISVSFLFSAVNLQKATKDELMCIKGIGDKKADAIIKYRKSHKLKSAADLIEIKGFGEGIIAMVKKGEKTVKCGGKKSTVKKSTKKDTKKKEAAKKDTKKKTDSKKTNEKKKSKQEKKKTDTKKKSEKKKSDKKKSDKE